MMACECAKGHVVSHFFDGGDLNPCEQVHGLKAFDRVQCNSRQNHFLEIAGSPLARIRIPPIKRTSACKS